MRYQAFVDEHTISVLTSLLGTTLGYARADAIDVEFDVAHAWGGLAILQNGEFVNVTSTWLTTPLHGVDYWQITVRRSNRPVGNTYDADRKRSVGASRVRLGPRGGASPVTAIEMFSTTDGTIGAQPDEAVAYDRLIRFTTAAGSQFVVGAGQTISETVVVTAHASGIDYLMLAGPEDEGPSAKLRLRLE